MMSNGVMNLDDFHYSASFPLGNNPIRNNFRKGDEV